MFIHSFIYIYQLLTEEVVLDPNFQNQPKRDTEQMQAIRGAIYPSKGHQLMELDYSQLEVRIAAAYHNDPTMMQYIERPQQLSNT